MTDRFLVPNKTPCMTPCLPKPTDLPQHMQTKNTHQIKYF